VARSPWSRRAPEGDPLRLAQELNDAGLAVPALAALDAAGPEDRARAAALRAEVAAAAERQLRNLALFELNEGDLAAALARAEAAMAVGPEPTASTRAVMAEVLAAVGRLDEALALAREVLAEAPTNDRAQRLLARSGGVG
jgi:tetratricopeptide (TPR) repeat protein